MANVLMKNRGQRPFYCAPDKLGLRAQQVGAIFSDFVDDHPDVKDTLPVIVLLVALQDTFPCAKS